MRRSSFAHLYLLVIVILASTAPAHAESSRPEDGKPPVAAELNRATDPRIHGAGVITAKAEVDTTLVMGPGGSGAPYRGDFEDDGGLPNWNGWTSVDLTVADGAHWHASTYRAVSGSMSAWCGDLSLLSCEAGDPDGGYGNEWYDILEWRQVVTDPAQATQLDITATANIDCEVGYDYVYLRADKAGTGMIDLASWDDRHDGLSIAESVTYLPGEYVGDGGNEVVVVWVFDSDFTWSDEDCSYPTAGAIQLDDVTIASDNGPGTGGVVDFEDGTLGPFQATYYAGGVGDFAQLWSNLEDEDPCRTNYTPQVAFIDDGIVVPGTGPSLCQDWCYGPNGYIVTTTGGLAGPDHHIHNAVVSPVMSWPEAGHRGGMLSFDVYRHEDLSADAPGIFYQWHVRSTSTPGGGDIGTKRWDAGVFLEFGGPEYYRHDEVINEWMAVGVQAVQIQLSVYELGWIFGWWGDDGTPAPYFDNVRLVTFPVVGPNLTTDRVYLAADAFPASGELDPADPAGADVRFDMAFSIAPRSGTYRDFGDSVVFDCVVTRPDAVLEGLPRMHYEVRTNAVFDAYRTDPTPYAGSVECQPVTGPAGLVVPDRYWADLPDGDWLFPGDVVHYYFRATDRDTLDSSLESAILPADTTGFSEFDTFRYEDGYDRNFTVRALPSVSYFEPGYGVLHPRILVWLQDEGDDHWDRWRTLLIKNLCFVPGADLDIFRSPAGLQASGLGAKATAAQLANYDAVVAVTGQVAGLGSEDAGDESPDVQLLAAWLDQEDHGLVLTGHHLAHGLSLGSIAANDFLHQRMGLAFASPALAPLIGGQDTPTVAAEPGNSVFIGIDSWAQGAGCMPATSDAVSVLTGTERLAEYEAPGGNPGFYPYAASSLRYDFGAGTRVMFVPYDLGSVAASGQWTRPPYFPVSVSNAAVLYELLRATGIPLPECISGIPDAESLAFAARAHPNPFNPQTRISWTAPRDGRLEVMIYDLKGRLLRTLVDEPVTAGAGSVDWNGTDARGAQMASGVYFFRVRQGGDVHTGKVALIR